MVSPATEFFGAVVPVDFFLAAVFFEMDVSEDFLSLAIQFTISSCSK
jgi:hypothetical protein